MVLPRVSFPAEPTERLSSANRVAPGHGLFNDGRRFVGWDNWPDREIKKRSPRRNRFQNRLGGICLRNGDAAVGIRVIVKALKVQTRRRLSILKKVQRPLFGFLSCPGSI